MHKGFTRPQTPRVGETGETLWTAKVESPWRGGPPGVVGPEKKTPVPQRAAVCVQLPRGRRPEGEVAPRREIRGGPKTKRMT